MATSNIKLFDENKGNMMGDTEYGTNTQRLNGVQQGIASSQLNNKFSYQTSLVAYALAQIMMQNGFNANDSDAVTTFVSNMSSTLLQKVTDKANQSLAEAGVNDTKYMTPLQVKNAINSIVPLLDSIASTSTKQLYGLGAEATPNDILSILSDSALYKTNGLYTITNDLIMPLPATQIYTGSYTGTGTYGSSNPNTLTFPFEPKLVFISISKTDNPLHRSGQLIYGSPIGIYMYSTSAIDTLRLTWGGNSLSWYCTSSATNQLNQNRWTYAYAAIG